MRNSDNKGAIRCFSPASADARDLWARQLKKPHLYQRDADFYQLMRTLVEGIKKLCRTDGRVLFLSSVGTGALECALAALPRHTRAVVVRNGYFGNRLFEIANLHFDEVLPFDLPFGEPFSEKHVPGLKKLAEEKAADLLAAVHLETSSTILNDVESIAETGRLLSILTLIDGISSLGAVDCHPGTWGIDCFVSSTYKALLCPAGLSLIIADDRFLNFADRRWSYTFDLPRVQQAALQDRILWSPGILSLRCLEDVLDSILKQGPNQYLQDLAERVSKFRSHLKRNGLEIFGAEEHLSPCYTALKLQQDSADLWLQFLKERFGIIIGKGLGEMPDRLLRIGHYPNTTPQEYDLLLEALRSAALELTP